MKGAKNCTPALPQWRIPGEIRREAAKDSAFGLRCSEIGQDFDRLARVLAAILSAPLLIDGFDPDFVSQSVITPPNRPQEIDQANEI